MPYSCLFWLLFWRKHACLRARGRRPRACNKGVIQPKKRGWPAEAPFYGLILSCSRTQLWLLHLINESWDKTLIPQYLPPSLHNCMNYTLSPPSYSLFVWLFLFLFLSECFPIFCTQRSLNNLPSDGIMDKLEQLR